MLKTRSQWSTKLQRKQIFFCRAQKNNLSPTEQCYQFCWDFQRNKTAWKALGCLIPSRRWRIMLPQPLNFVSKKQMPFRLHCSCSCEMFASQIFSRIDAKNSIWVLIPHLLVDDSSQCQRPCHSLLTVHLVTSCKKRTTTAVKMKMPAVIAIMLTGWSRQLWWRSVRRTLPTQPDAAL